MTYISITAMSVMTIMSPIINCTGTPCALSLIIFYILGSA